MINLRCKLFMGGYMTISEMLGQSGLLTLLGMCVVFGFLIILIVFMKLLQVVVHSFKLDKDIGKKSEKSIEKKQESVAVPSSSAVDKNAIVAAIVAAIREKQSI